MKHIVWFLAFAGSLLFTAGLLPCQSDDTPPHILLRSSWQTVNIGDIAHSPGVMHLLKKHIPKARVTLWSGRLDRGVDQLLQKNFPDIPQVQGRILDNGKASNAALQKAIDSADFLLHGSGPSLVATKDVAAWREHVRKPYGVYGITLSAVSDDTRPLLNDARFVFLRDSISLKLAKSEKIQAPVVEFGPDGAFACHLRNEKKALAFLEQHGLEPGKFLCVIPRYRYTPYWKIRNRAMTETDKARDKINTKMKESDHKKVRDALIAFVRKTGMKVLVCPEDVSQVAIGKEMFVDKLPDDVKQHVVWRDQYWLTDEALSVYVRSLALLSMDLHSPIMAVANGIPAVYCYFAEQTSKPEMWEDIGLGFWRFDLDKEKDGKQITKAILAIAANPQEAKRKVNRAMELVQRRQRETMAIVAKQLVKE